MRLGAQAPAGWSFPRNEPAAAMRRPQRAENGSRGHSSYGSKVSTSTWNRSGRVCLASPGNQAGAARARDRAGRCMGERIVDP